MTRRTHAYWALPAAAVALLLGLLAVPAGGSDKSPSVKLSTTVLVPGHTLVITGSGWTPKASVNATICGADAVSGTVDCSATSTATMAATARGLLWSHVAIVDPPVPCPCVVAVSGTNITYARKIPVTVVGAPTQPVRRAQQESSPTVRVSGFKVVGGPTLGSFFGGRAPKTLQFHLSNTWDHPVTPVLIGRWGKEKDLSNVIQMPHMGPLQPGDSRFVSVPFSLTALSMGTYAVSVQVQLVGLSREFSDSTTTSQWPWGLFIVGLLLILAIAYVIVARRRKRADKTERPQTLPADGHGSEEPAPKDLATTPLEDFTPA